MTIENCYERMHGNYPDVLRRMGNAERVERFLLKFPQDSSYSLLCKSIDTRNLPEAFRAAHSLKGICMNLGLTRLFEYSSALTEALRGDTWNESCFPLFEQVQTEYASILGCIHALCEEW